jgi:hypothetical protein
MVERGDKNDFVKSLDREYMTGNFVCQSGSAEDGGAVGQGQAEQKHLKNLDSCTGRIN